MTRLPQKKADYKTNRPLIDFRGRFCFMFLSQMQKVIYRKNIRRTVAVQRMFCYITLFTLSVGKQTDGFPFAEFP